MSNLAHAVAANIRLLREEAGLSVRELAGALGVSKAVVSAWENRHNDVPLRRLEAIAYVLRVPVARLLATPPETVPAPPVSVGDLRETLVWVMDLGGCFGANMSAEKDVLIWVDGMARRLSSIGPSFHNGRFVLMLVAGAPDPASGSAAWYAEHPGAAETARALGMAVPTGTAGAA